MMVQNFSRSGDEIPEWFPETNQWKGFRRGVMEISG
jgi:hypothetical protein